MDFVLDLDRSLGTDMKEKIKKGILVFGFVYFLHSLRLLRVIGAVPRRLVYNAFESFWCWLHRKGLIKNSFVE